MTIQWTTGRTDSRGFTLVELMVVIVIASILMAIAIPSYKTSIRKSRRTDAKTALLDLAGRE
jgi:type IV pilus assembly protein PilE